MKPLQWQPYMALGIEELDEAHRTFVAALAALHECPDRQLGAGIAG